MVCCRGVVKSWVPQSSITYLLYYFSLCFPFIDLFCSSEPCTVVFQVTTLCSLSSFIFHKLIQVIFPSLGWSSCFSFRPRRYHQSRIPLGGFSGPSVWAIGGDSQRLSPFQFLLWFDDPICVIVCQHFSSASLALLFMQSIQSSNSSSWLDVLSVSSSNEILLSWSYSSFAPSSSCASSLTSSFGCCLFHQSFHSFSFGFSLRLNDETKQSALGWRYTLLLV